MRVRLVSSCVFYMMVTIYFFVGLFIQNVVSARVYNDFYVSTNRLNENDGPGTLLEFDLITYLERVKAAKEKDTVLVQVYYESLCPGCIQFYTESLTPVIQSLGQYINIKTYPYGNAQTIIDDNGKYEFKCQHGPAECYGNKLHACALDLLQNKTQALIFNSCLMTQRRNSRGSDDKAADACGTEQNVKASAIKQCAKGNKGNQLLKYYGEESKEANFNYVPYVLIQGRVNDGDNFMRDVCAAFVKPPPPCNGI